MKNKLLASLLALGLSASLAGADFQLIVNPGVPQADVSKEDIKNIFLGNVTKWQSGEVVKLGLLTEGPAADASAKEIAARTADQLSKYWKKQVFTGKGSSPEILKTDADAVAFVAKTAGAVAAVSPGTDVSTVKVLTIK